MSRALIPKSALNNRRIDHGHSEEGRLSGRVGCTEMDRPTASALLSQCSVNVQLDRRTDWHKPNRSSCNAIHIAFHRVVRHVASNHRDEYERSFEMSEKFNEPKIPRLSIWPLIIAGSAGAVAIGMIVINPTGSGLFAPDHLDGAGKLKQEISYCRPPDFSSHHFRRVSSGRAKPVAGSDARRAT
jgi:hypothetical protein